MAKIITYQGSMDALVWHKECKGMDCDTEIIVPVAHEAILVKDGKIFESFTMGRYNLDECAVGEGRLFATPGQRITCRVFYVKKEGQYNIKWETPLCITDPVLKIKVELALGGVFAIKIFDSKAFLQSLLANTKKAGLDEAKVFFREKMLLNIKSNLMEVMAESGVSTIDLAGKLMTVSKELEMKMRYIFEPYGVSIENLQLKKLELLSGGVCGTSVDGQPQNQAKCQAKDSDSAKIMYCTACGKDLPPQSKFCYQCGKKIE